MARAHAAAERGETPPIGSAEWSAFMAAKIKRQQAMALVMGFSFVAAVVIGVAYWLFHVTSAAPVVNEAQRDAAWADEMKGAILKRLRDPQSAIFTNTATYRGSGSPVVCGHVNSKNGFGGYAGTQRFVAAGDLSYLESEMQPGAMDSVWRQVCR